MLWCRALCEFIACCRGVSADKLEVTKIVGLMGEELTLFTRLKAIPHATKWLATLEKYMKTTMLTIMEACIQARLEDGTLGTARRQ